MQTIPSRPADTYSPLYFLSSLGAGGLAVTFFMYLLFWVPHPGAPVPVFEDIARAFAGGHLALQASIVIAVIGIAAFAFLNLKTLFWNLGQLRRFNGTPAHVKLMTSNAETQFLAMPLALAMSVHVGFILGLVFIPGLWSVVEYLFPLAMLAFLTIGIIALRQIGRFIARVIGTGSGFNMAANGSFAQVLPAFALAMVAVGFSAPAALSTTPAIVGAGLIMSGFFGTIAVVYALIAIVVGVVAIIQHGAAKEGAPTLLIVVPLLTVLGIMFMRQNHGLHTTFGTHVTEGETLMLLTQLLTVQVMFTLFGLIVLRAQGYADAFLRGTGNSAGAYALVCPGVALSVMTHFWINKGLVEVGMIAKFGAAYWALTAVALAFQIAMIGLVLYLNRRHFGRAPATAAVPAE